MNFEEEKGNGDADLCCTPAVDADYLVTLSTRLATFAAQKKSKIDTGLLLQEGVKKRLQEAREARLGRLSAIKMQHRQILDMVSTLFGIEYKVVEEGVIDDPSHVKLIESLTEEGGRRAVVFLYQEMEPPPAEAGRGLPENTPPFRRIVVTDGSDIPCKDRAIVVYRTKGHINIEQKNVCDVRVKFPENR
ncbi:hypothetical protein RUM44_003267 [Polyplax serrata]|uniref:Uncharacterized protein n=1 Tax=Polyplax serrata TaxID=468196 RepID=A0ABR1AFZ6_POLSC